MRILTRILIRLLAGEFAIDLARVLVMGRMLIDLA